MLGNNWINRDTRAVPAWLPKSLSVLVPISLMVVICFLGARPAIERGPLEPGGSNRRVDQQVVNKSRRTGTPATSPPIWAENGSKLGSLKLSPDDKYIAAVIGRPGEHFRWRVLLIERRSGAVVVDVPVRYHVLTCFTPASDALAVYTAGAYPFARTTRGVVYVYSIVDGAKKTEIEVTEPGYWQAVDAIGLSRNGRKLAVLDLSKAPESRRAWDFESRQPIDFEEEAAYLWSGSGLSPNGELCSVGGWPGPGVRIRRFGSRELSGFCLRDSLPAVGSSFSDDSRLWATVYEDGVFAIWDVRASARDSETPLLVKHGFEECAAFAMSHDLKHLVYTQGDGSIRMTTLNLPNAE